MLGFNALSSGPLSSLSSLVLFGRGSIAIKLFSDSSGNVLIASNGGTTLSIVSRSVARLAFNRIDRKRVEVYSTSEYIVPTTINVESLTANSNILSIDFSDTTTSISAASTQDSYIKSSEFINTINTSSPPTVSVRTRISRKKVIVE